MIQGIKNWFCIKPVLTCMLLIFVLTSVLGFVQPKEVYAQGNYNGLAAGVYNYGTKENTGNSEAIQCITGSGVSLGIDMNGCFAKVAYVFLFFASWVLWLAAVVFNITIEYSLNMAGFLEKIDMVSIGWQTFRDFANLFFIFIILYIAINTILGISSFGIKTLLGKVIIAAILINFSLFFTKVIIDTSNIFALQFYTKIIHDSGGKAGQYESLQEADGGISAALASAMGMETVYSIGRSAQNSSGTDTLTPENGEKSGLKLNAANLIIVGFAGGVFVLITAAVFLAGALMLFMRAISLIFIMILSPFAFLGGVLPSTQKYASMWWGKLFQNAIFAPAYMALMYLVLSMILERNSFEKGDFVTIFSGDTGKIDTIITFIILNALMVGCIIIAKQLGVQGAGFASKILATTGTLAGSTTFGAAALAGRNIVGRAANFYSNTDMAKSRTGTIGRTITGLTNKIANSSFDARQIGGVGKKLGIGSGSEKGIKGLIADRNKAREAAVAAEGEMFNNEGKAALAAKRQKSWFEATRKGGFDMAKKTREEDSAKVNEILTDLTTDPDYKEFDKIVGKSKSSQGISREEFDRAKDLYTNLNRKIEKVKKFNTTLKKWESFKNSKGEDYDPEFIQAGFDTNNMKIIVNQDLAREIARNKNEYSRFERTLKRK